jgi:hypothetical protein
MLLSKNWNTWELSFITPRLLPLHVYITKASDSLILFAVSVQTGRFVLICFEMNLHLSFKIQIIQWFDNPSTVFSPHHSRMASDCFRGTRHAILRSPNLHFKFHRFRFVFHWELYFFILFFCPTSPNNYNI